MLLTENIVRMHYLIEFMCEDIKERENNALSYFFSPYYYDSDYSLLLLLMLLCNRNLSFLIEF